MLRLKAIDHVGLKARIWTKAWQRDARAERFILAVQAAHGGI